jgi:hypothetical protein
VAVLLNVLLAVAVGDLVELREAVFVAVLVVVSVDV